MDEDGDMTIAGTIASTNITDGELSNGKSITLVDSDVGDYILTIDADDSITWNSSLAINDLEIEAEIYMSGDNPIIAGDGWEINLRELANSYKTHTIQQQTIIIRKEETMSLTSISGILLVMVICVITVKYVIPRLSFKYFFRKFFRLIYKPAQEAKAEWEEAKKE